MEDRRTFSVDLLKGSKWARSALECVLRSQAAVKKILRSRKILFSSKMVPQLRQNDQILPHTDHKAELQLQMVTAWVLK